MSGPTLFGLADLSMWCCSFLHFGLEAMAMTSEMSLRFLRPCRGSKVRCRATIVSAGRRSVVMHVGVYTDDEARLCAVAQGTYVLASRISRL